MLSFVFGLTIGLILGAVFSTLIFKVIKFGRSAAKQAAAEATVEINKAKTKI